MVIIQCTALPRNITHYIQEGNYCQNQIVFLNICRNAEYFKYQVMLTFQSIFPTEYFTRTPNHMLVRSFSFGTMFLYLQKRLQSTLNVDFKSLFTISGNLYFLQAIDSDGGGGKDARSVYPNLNPEITLRFRLDSLQVITQKYGIYQLIK